MLAVCLAASTAFAPSSGVVAPSAARVAAPMMAGNRKMISFDESVVFEAREVNIPRKPCVPAASPLCASFESREKVSR